MPDHAPVVGGPGPQELGLLTDLYEFTMAQAYWSQNMHERAVFSLFFRELPATRNLVLACGQEAVCDLVQGLRFPREQVEKLASTGLFEDRFLTWLEDYRFKGNIWAVPEGTPVFPNEPILEVEASVIEGQLLESLLMNVVNTETLLASKALRYVLAANGRPVLDFGMRRMHGLDAALRSSRAYYVAGITGTSNVLGSLRSGLPARGTMSHSFIQAMEDEEAAFRTYANLYPGTILLVDTFDTMRAVDRVIRLVRDEGLNVGGIRLDSGDLESLSRACRKRLDSAGLYDIRIVVSGGLNEHRIASLLAARAPIDGFGVGTEMGSVADAPTLDFAYKLTEYAGIPRLKNSPGKELIPGAKQVWRFEGSTGDQFVRDEITLRSEKRKGIPLLTPLIHNGERVYSGSTPEDSHDNAWFYLDRLPANLRALEAASTPYPVTFSDNARKARRQALGTATG